MSIPSKEFRDDTKIKKKIEVYKDDFEWFLRTHEIDGDTSRTGFPAVINMLFHCYRTVCENPKEHMEEMEGLALINVATQAAKLAKEEIEI
jgi:hypothetical protein